jgi:hypothetical protein
MDKNELANVLRLRQLWLADVEGGVKANLRGSAVAASPLVCVEFPNCDIMS